MVNGRQLQDMSLRGPVGNFDAAIVYAGIGEKEVALEYLEKGFEKHEGMMVFLKHWGKIVPWFNEDQRILALAKKIGLPS
jgi:hypothetical protein